ncbi:MAG: SHOCT domain-containing protein [Betaproteobacteria bacterium]|nr:SHOCT domain-containing protein [Betaproteobacteria bacterium]
MGTHMGYMGWGPDWGTGWGMLGFLHMGLWWILLILGIVVLVRWLLGERTAGSGQALAVLKLRYARGELDQDEYERRKRDIAA